MNEIASSSACPCLRLSAEADLMNRSVAVSKTLRVRHGVALPSDWVRYVCSRGRNMMD